MYAAVIYPVESAPPSRIARIQQGEDEAQRRRWTFDEAVGMGAKVVQKKHPLIKKNDKVVVLTGKEKGKIGTVLKVDSEKGRAVVEKINMVKRHTRPGGKQAQGGIIEKAAPLQISNLMILCTKCAEPTRIGKRVLEDGSKVRICRKCGELLDS